MSVLGNNILAGASGQGGGYTIDRSLRFRSSASAYLSRTPASAGNRKTWTYSIWFKYAGVSTQQMLGGAGSSGNEIYIQFTSTGELQLRQLNSSTQTMLLQTSQVFRDPSAWYHIVIEVDTTQATSSDRIKIYINGSQITAFSTASYYSLNYDSHINNNVAHYFGRRPSSGSLYFDGYLTEVNFIDGQALDASSFGEYNDDTGVWQPKKYTGTYGTNGFYLNFSDNSSTTTLGEDGSGNGNDWTLNNFSLTSGSTYDSMLDVPTLTSESAGNYCTLSPLQKGPYITLSNGNLRVTGSSATNSAVALGTLSPTSGKWYWEVTQGTTVSEFIGVMTKTVTGESLIDGSTLAQTLGKGVVARYNGFVRGISGELQSVSAFTWTNGDIIQLAVDLDNGAVYFGKNNTWLNSGDPTSGASKTGSFLNFTQDGTRCCTPACDAYNTGYVDANFGQRPFAYTPPAGFKSLNTYNLPDSTIVDGSQYFNTVLYTGNGTSQSITGVNFQPDFVWVKRRSAAASHILEDAVRGATQRLISNSTGEESTDSGSITSFDSDGFSVGSTAAVNSSAGTFVAWNWKANGSGVSNTDGSIASTVSANTTAGFSIVTYTGTGANATVGHGLNDAPKMVIVKQRDTGTVTDWYVYHPGLTSAANFIRLNLPNGQGTNASVWNSTAPTSSVINLGSYTETNASTKTYVAYCFADVEGYSKFGSYTGNGDPDGPFVYTGFRPAFVMIKESTSTGSWPILDTTRSPYNVINNDSLWANLPDGEGGAAAYFDILSNGFKIRDTDSDKNTNTQTYIYMALAENPFKNSLAR